MYVLSQFHSCVRTQNIADSRFIYYGCPIYVNTKTKCQNTNSVGMEAIVIPEIKAFEQVAK